MTPIPLHEFVDRHGQDEVAKVLGSSQAAISKAIKAGRLILISEERPGCFTGVELKGFPSGGDREKPRLDLEEILSQIIRVGESTVGAVNPSSSGAAQ
ncbi:Cro/CI family transcriptional regulator [Pseudomonas orientalis]|uniref:Cro/CI family transcriptional regulator n=1 Tax=Pseudomonas orientalis TaxID=76758 RepID=UPI000F588E05|nr:Cro/CI family transcriptional regulator [Pseudomonas orientalis]